MLEGDERYEIDGRTIAVRPGDFLYLEAGSPCVGTNRTDMIGLCLLLPHPRSGVAAGGAFGDDPLMGRAHRPVDRAQARSAGRCALMRAGSPTIRRSALCSPTSWPLASPSRSTEPLDESRAAMDGLKAAKLSTRRELHRRLERARGFLHENAGRNVSLAEMASVAGLSQFHLARYFKAAFGQSPITYHRALRLARAAELLTAGGRSVADVAEATGYSDQVALSHAFRRQYGAPPHMWANGQRRAS